LVTEAARALEEDHLGSAPALAGLDQRLVAVAWAHDRFFRASPARAMLFHQARGLLELDEASGPPLRRAFTDYLERVGRFLFPGANPKSRALVDAAIAVTGTIAGHRSFSRAAGLASRPAAVSRLLLGGVPGLVSRRPR
jgi:hypothetical protein